MSIEVGIVRMVNTDSIEVSDRTRKVMGNLDELEQTLTCTVGMTFVTVGLVECFFQFQSTAF